MRYDYFINNFEQRWFNIVKYWSVNCVKSSPFWSIIKPQNKKSKKIIQIIASEKL